MFEYRGTEGPPVYASISALRVVFLDIQLLEITVAEFICDGAHNPEVIHVPG